MGAVRRSVRRVAGPAWPGTPLTGSQVELVRLVRRQPGVSVAAAAAELRLAANTVSTLVRQLTDAEILVRVADPDDRRVARLRLTDTASRRLHAWRDERHQRLADAIATLPADRRRTLRKAVPVLSEVADLLQDKGDEVIHG
ncbi:MAG: MarR family transcriptional regulator [Streptosporangiales bacterium]|nr:MarR family transcriptional regulator [Streptosporangiales bacterium]MBO0889545.1 MarR family transcriptional regulator [Acidothermales bacterium]